MSHTAPRDTKVEVRVTRAEKGRLEAAARARGRTASDFLRNLWLTRAERAEADWRPAAVAERSLPPEAMRALAEVARMGGLLRLVATRLEKAGSLDASARAELSSVRDGLVAAASAINGTAGGNAR